MNEKTIEIKDINTWMIENVIIPQKREQTIIQGNTPDDWYEEEEQEYEEEEE